MTDTRRNVPADPDLVITRESCRAETSPGLLTSTYSEYMKDRKDWSNEAYNAARHVGNMIMQRIMDPVKYGESSEDWEGHEETYCVEVFRLDGYSFLALINENQLYLGTVELWQRNPIHLRPAVRVSAE